MVRKTLVLGFLFTLAAVELATAGKGNMNNSICVVQDRDGKNCVRSLNAKHQDIDESSDEEEGSKTKKIAAKKAVKTEQSEGFFAWFFKKIMSIFS